MFSIEKTLKYAFSDESSFVMLRNAICNELAVSNSYYLQLSNFYNEFYSEHKSLPKKGDIKVWLKSKNEKQRPILKSAYENIISQDISDYTKEFVLNEAVTGLREKATKNAINRMEATGTTSPELMADMLEQINSIKTAHLGNVVDIRDVNEWLPLEDDLELKWKTGIQKLDRYIGGIGSELIFVMGGTGIGKTTFLINLAKSIAAQGGNVLHISLELFDRITAHRYYRRIAEASKDEFIHEYDNVKGLVDHWLRWVDGNIHIVYHPAFSISVSDVKAIVRQYVDEYGDVDLVILDYLDIISADKGYGRMDSWEKLGRMSHEIRSVCPEHDTAVASAAQANREGMDASRLKYRHMAGSVQKLQAADLVFGLMQDDEEQEVNQGRLINLKVRESPGKGQEIPLYIDMDKMFILDLDHPDSQRIIREEMEEEVGTHSAIYT